jgi:hypothetical protein
MSSLTAKRPFILASLAIAITPPLSAAISGSECARVPAHANTVFLLPAKERAPAMHGDDTASGAGLQNMFGGAEGGISFRAGLGGTLDEAPPLLTPVLWKPSTATNDAASYEVGRPAGTAVTAGISNLSNRDFMSGAVGSGLVPAWPKASIDAPRNPDFPNKGGVKQTDPGRSSADRAGQRDADFYRRAHEAIDHGILPDRSYLAARDIGAGFQLRVLGAPAPPLEGENAGDRSQAQFPIFSVAW